SGRTMGTRVSHKPAIASWRVAVEHRSDGTILVDPRLPLGTYPQTLTACLEQWARHAPHRTFLAQRSNAAAWRRITYGEVWDRAMAIARWLVAAGLSEERPIAILSGNDIEHALLAIGAMYAGVPYAPISPAYSLISSDFARLRQVFDLLTPGLVFASD